MKKIELFERAIEEQAASLKEWNINGTLFWAYRKSKAAGNDLIDFAEVLWDNEVKEISDFLKANEVTEFTISSTASGLIEILAAFEKEGYRMAGLTEAKADYTDLMTGKNKVMPAIRLSL